MYIYFCKNLNFDILIRSNMNGNLKTVTWMILYLNKLNRQSIV